LRHLSRERKTVSITPDREKNRLPSARILTMMSLVVVKRQAAAGQPTTSQPAMSAKDGSIVAFNTAGVYLDSVAKGL
jgi:hypothetical protein